MKTPRILIIYTGGTIGMIEDPVSHALKPFDFNHLIDNVPKVKMLGYDIDHLQFDPPIDSSDMCPERWQEIARAIADHYHSYDGFVVLHGTDTMAYTASALSLMLGNLHKPVIITGSQLPVGEVRTDGDENLITALQIAATTRTDAHGQVTPMVQEVAILFENYLWRGNRATKISADNFNAFRSNNYPPLASIGLTINFNEDALRRPDPATRHDGLDVHYAMDPSVMIIDLFPGLSEATLRYLLEAPGIRGVVLRSYGAGNAPTASWFTDAIRHAIANRDLVLVNITQCINGAVSPDRYVAGDLLAATGVTSGRDMTVEAALAKLMLLFGRGLTPDAVRNAIATPLAGEVTA